MYKSSAHCVCQSEVSIRPAAITGIQDGTYPGVIEASVEIKIPKVQVCKSHLPDLGLVDEVSPGADVLQGHQVVDVLDRVLGSGARRTQC